MVPQSSLLCRLSDSYGASTEHSFDTLKKNLVEDLENFLNSRSYLPFSSDDDRKIRTSILDYGLRDFSSLDIDRTDSQESMRAEIEQKLLSFFHCFENIEVEISDRSEAQYGTHFELKINALLRVESLSEPFHLMASMQCATRTIVLSEANDE